MDGCIWYLCVLTNSTWVLLIAFQQLQQSFFSYFHGAKSGRSCRFLCEKIHPFEDGLKLTFLKFNSELTPKEKKQMPRKRITVIELSLSCIKFQGVSRCSEKTYHKRTPWDLTCYINSFTSVMESFKELDNSLSFIE